jgi:ABC-type Fe3+ transport system substrate-binding protein
MTTSPVRAFALAALCAAAGACLGPSPARAQSGWEAEWKKTIAAAEQEGTFTLLLPPSNTQRDFLQEEWPKSFPNIKLSMTTAEGNTWFVRVKTEREAGKYLWDLSIGGPTTLYSEIPNGLLDPLLPELILPEVKDEAAWGGWNTAFYDEQRKYILGVLNDFEPIWYNAKLVPPAEVKAKGVRILLDPAYKGKIVWQEPRTDGPGTLFATFLHKVLGDADYRKLLTEQKPMIFAAGDQATDAMVRERGFFFLGPVLSDRLRPYEQAGMKFDMRPLGNDPESGFLGTDGVSVAVFNKRPHPNAARLFVNWLLTKQMSQELAQIQQMNSRRTDVAPVTAPETTAIPGKTYVEPARADMVNYLRSVQALTRELVP